MRPGLLIIADSALWTARAVTHLKSSYLRTQNVAGALRYSRHILRSAAYHRENTMANVHHRRMAI